MKPLYFKLVPLFTPLKESIEGDLLSNQLNQGACEQLVNTLTSNFL